MLKTLLAWTCLIGLGDGRRVKPKSAENRNPLKLLGRVFNSQILVEGNEAQSYNGAVPNCSNPSLTTLVRLILKHHSALASFCPFPRLPCRLPPLVSKKWGQSSIPRTQTGNPRDVRLSETIRNLLPTAASPSGSAVALGQRSLRPSMSGTWTEPQRETEQKNGASLYGRAVAQVHAMLEEAENYEVVNRNNVHYNTFLNVIAALEHGLIERHWEARLLVLALVGGEHLLLLGPPGTAKSALCRRLSSIAGLTYFERTLTRFSTPEELFGPLSLSALERDEFKRATAGYAPDAQIVFIDEIFKSNSAILNTLLTLLNERLFDDGSERRRAPLLSAVAASNEGPESEDLDALYDRFLLRKVVSPVSMEGAIELLMLPSSKGNASGQRTPAVNLEATTLKQSLLKVQDQASDIILPRWSALLLAEAREHVSTMGSEDGSVGYVSDRRLRSTGELLKASAAAHGRTRVSVTDALAVLPHVLWEEEEQAAPLSEWIEEHILPEARAEDIRFLLDGLLARAKRHAKAITKTGVAKDHKLSGDVEALTDSALEAAAEMRGHQAALNSAHEHLFLPPDYAAAVRQKLMPDAANRAADLENLAVQAMTLGLFLLEGGMDPRLMAYDPELAIAEQKMMYDKAPVPLSTRQTETFPSSVNGLTEEDWEKYDDTDVKLKFGFGHDDMAIPQRGQRVPKKGTVLRNVPIVKVTQEGVWAVVDPATKLQGFMFPTGLDTGYIEDVENTFTVGDRVDAIAIGVSSTSGRVMLSRKLLIRKEGWERHELPNDGRTKPIRSDSADEFLDQEDEFWRATAGH